VIDRKIILVILLLILIVAGWLFQAGRVIESTFMTGDFYRKLFQKVDLTPYAQEMMREELIESVPLTIPDDFMDVITNQLSEVYDRQWLEKELLVIIDDLLLYIKGNRQPPPIHLSLTEKNEQIRERIKEAMLNKKQEIPFLSIFNTSLIDQGIDALVDNIPLPPYYDLNEYFSEKGVTDDIISSVNRFKSFRQFYLYFPFIAGIICLAFFFYKCGLVKMLKSYGIGIVIAGITFLLVLLARYPLFLNSMERNMQAEDIMEFTAAVTAIDYAISKSLHIPVFFILFGLIFILAGLLLDLFILNPADENEQYQSSS